MEIVYKSLLYPEPKTAGYAVSLFITFLTLKIISKKTIQCFWNLIFSNTNWCTKFRIFYFCFWNRNMLCIDNVYYLILSWSRNFLIIIFFIKSRLSCIKTLIFIFFFLQFSKLGENFFCIIPTWWWDFLLFRNPLFSC